MSRTIEVTVLPNGQCQIETKGFVGNECQQASQFLKQALGVQTAETLKPEFYQSSESTVTHAEHKGTGQ